MSAWWGSVTEFVTSETEAKYSTNVKTVLYRKFLTLTTELYRRDWYVIKQLKRIPLARQCL